MTKLSDLTRRVSAPAPGDRLYLVDVSDTTDGPGGSGGYATVGDLQAVTAASFATRAAAQAAQVPAGLAAIWVAGLPYQRDPAGTALVTGDGAAWSPTGSARFEHWGAVGNGTTDDTAAILAATTWCAQAHVPLRPYARIYRVSGPVIDYDLETMGGSWELTLIGDGPSRTVFWAPTGLSGGFFARIYGVDSIATGINVRYWTIENVEFRSPRSSGANDTGTLYETHGIDITAADHVDLRNVLFQSLRGRAIRARKWWDSVCDIIAYDCGISTPGSQAEVVWLGNILTGIDYEETTCNNIFFPKSVQIERARWKGMYWGPYTRKNTFHGKIHGKLDEIILEPHLHLDGAYENYIIGANFTAADGMILRIDDDAGILVPYGNSIIGCSFQTGPGTHVIEMSNGFRNRIVANAFSWTGTGGGVLVTGGDENVVRLNTIPTGKTECTLSAPTVMAEERIWSDIRMQVPGSTILLQSPNGTFRSLSLGDDGRLYLGAVVVGSQS